MAGAREVKSQDHVREDYHKMPKLTLAEAALVAGVKPRTVSAWIRLGKVARANVIGAYIVDHESLKKFLESGIAQV